MVSSDAECDDSFDLTTLYIEQNIDSMLKLLKNGKPVQLLVPTKANQIIEHQIKIWKTPSKKLALKSVCDHNQWDVPLIYLYQVVILENNIIDSLKLALEKLILRVKSNSLLITQCSVCNKPTCKNICFDCFPYTINNIKSDASCAICFQIQTPTRFSCCKCSSRICFLCFSKSKEAISSNCSKCGEMSKIINKRKMCW
jgi:hypothetical protein